MGSLANHLMKLLNIRFRSPVLKVRPSGNGQGPYQVDIGGPDPKSLVLDRVIFALLLPLVLPIFEEFPDHLKRLLQAVRYAPSLVCVMGLERSYPPAAFINNTLRDEFQTISTIIFDDQKKSNRNPEDKSLITVIVGEKAGRELLNAPEDSITLEVKRELNALFPGLDREILFEKLFRWEYAAVQLQPGALARQSQTREALKQAHPNLYFISDGLYNSSIEVQMKVAVQAAEEIIATTQGS
jgi:protoporphyrinogen oxidase